MEDPKKNWKYDPDDVTSVDFDLNDFSNAPEKKTSPKSTKNRQKRRMHEERGVGRIPAYVVGSLALVFVSTAVVMVMSHQQGVTPTEVIQQAVQKVTRSTVEEAPSEERSPNAVTGTSAAPTQRSAEQLRGSGQSDTREMEPLSPEDQLALTDPKWRRKWEYYKRMFMLAQQMRQQPPVRPQMPNKNPTPTPEIPKYQEGESDNPFGFPKDPEAYE